MVTTVDPSGSDERKPDGRVGQTLNGKWRIDRLIDVGGMATVYEATHRNGRRAAIKVLHASVAANPDPTMPIILAGDQLISARSRHTGGVNAARCDGSVSFFPNSVSAFTWKALGTATHGEVFSE